MIENLKRIREPLAWTAIALTILNMGLTGWRLATALGHMSLIESLQEVGSSWLNISLALLVVVLVLSCSLVVPATRRAMAVARVALIVLSLGVLATLVSVLMGMWASAGATVVLDFLGGLLDVAFKALTAGTVWVFLRGVKAGRIETASATSPQPAEGDGTSTTGADQAAETTTTTWSRDEAAGAVWWTAADAAAGEPGRDKMPDPEAAQPPE